MKAPAPKPEKKRAPAKKAPAPKGAKKPARKLKPKAAKANQAVAPVVAIDEDALTPDDHDLCGLTIREARFIDLYLGTWKVGQSYIEAGYNVKDAYVGAACGSRLLNGAKARKYLAMRAKAMFARMEEEQDRLMLVHTQVAYADPNELVEHRRGACRYCYGRLHRYQFTAGEWERDLEAHEAKREKLIEADKPDPGPLDTKGGVGFDRRREPNYDCPECGGIGKGEMVLKDTRNLSPAALALYAGAKQTKDGLEIVMHSQDKARDILTKIRKMYDDNTSVTVNFNAAEMEDKFAATMAKSHQRMAEMREQRKLSREQRGD